MFPLAELQRLEQAECQVTCIANETARRISSARRAVETLKQSQVRRQQQAGYSAPQRANEIDEEAKAC
ncbi:hypothetical protein PR048_029872 [Dryococelus australis]|uniref:Uncharacterized protein n=1 Tax=Dryococelus australis TaxID=614101 RepID=A0ABQ9G7D3_9NEOP|nr:hypothetical protein PR048_029872 [Dryococelus australis]